MAFVIRNEKDLKIPYFSESVDQTVYSVLVDIAKKSNLNFRQVNQSINVQKNIQERPLKILLFQSKS